MLSLLWQSVLHPYQRLPVETEREGEGVLDVFGRVKVFSQREREREKSGEKEREVGQTIGCGDRIADLEEGVMSPLFYVNFLFMII